MDVGVIETFMAMINAPKSTSVKGGIVVVTVTEEIMKKPPSKKNSHYSEKRLWLSNI